MEEGAALPAGKQQLPPNLPQLLEIADEKCSSCTMGHISMK